VNGRHGDKSAEIAETIRRSILGTIGVLENSERERAVRHVRNYAGRYARSDHVPRIFLHESLPRMQAECGGDGGHGGKGGLTVERRFTWEGGTKSGVVVGFCQQIPRLIVAIMLLSDGTLQGVPIDQLRLQEAVSAHDPAAAARF
jgi:hypothetical protein